MREPLAYQIHDPNTPEAMEKFLVKWLAEINRSKVEEIIKKQALETEEEGEY